MTTRELYELASMDALGLLDNDERLAFENAFRAAPPHVQAEIRREQLREAQSTDFLPDVNPPASLRARVIAAVLGKAELLNTEPIAAIGPAPRSAASTAAFWRAACIGFATATVVLAGFVYTVAEQNKSIAQEALDGNITGVLGDIGGEALVDLATSPTSQKVSFTQTPKAVADSDNNKAGAGLLYDAERQEGYLLYNSLPIDVLEYTITFGDGRTQTFKANKAFSAVHLDDIKPEELKNFQIIAPSRDGSADVILKGADL